MKNCRASNQNSMLGDSGQREREWASDRERKSGAQLEMWRPTLFFNVIVKWKRVCVCANVCMGRLWKGRKPQKRWWGRAAKLALKKPRKTTRQGSAQQLAPPPNNTPRPRAPRVKNGNARDISLRARSPQSIHTSQPATLYTSRFLCSKIHSGCALSIISPKFRILKGRKNWLVNCEKILICY